MIFRATILKKTNLNVASSKFEMEMAALHKILTKYQLQVKFRKKNFCLRSLFVKGKVIKSAPGHSRNNKAMRKIFLGTKF